MIVFVDELIVSAPVEILIYWIIILSTYIMKWLLKILRWFWWELPLCFCLLNVTEDIKITFVTH